MQVPAHHAPGKGPDTQGLYDPRNEHDACGVGMVAHIKGEKSHAIIEQALTILANLDHRGAVGADPLLGDGAGLLIQTPDPLIRKWADVEGHVLPGEGDYALAMCFLPQEDEAREFVEKQLERFAEKEGQRVVGWRDVPTTLDGLGDAVIASMPVIRQCVIARGTNCVDNDAFERKLVVIRKQTLNPLAALEEKHNIPGLSQAYIPSFSSRTVVYKGLLLANQVGSFYDDLRDPDCVSALGLVHQRFSTNTFPSWRLAHPYRFMAHNGEINTVRGNVNWMEARRRTMESELLGADLDKMWPLIPHGQSDTACLDNALELLLTGGYSLAHSMMMLMPEAWAKNEQMDPARRAFYEYHAALMEPWDGPAAVCFTDGRQIGACLDRNGLRPARWCTTKDDLVVLASESGVLPFAEEDITRKWRLQPGKMLLIDLEQGRIVEDEELKADLAAAEPYEAWLDKAQYKLADLDHIEPDLSEIAESDIPLLKRQQAFGYTQEDLSRFLEPMAAKGEDPIGSMGTDTPIAVLSEKSRLLYDYFKQNFAQVTNPPIDPIREELVMSLLSMIGPRPNLLGRDGGTHKRLEVSQPILTNDDLAKIRSVEVALDGAFRTATIDITWDASTGADGLAMALKEMCWAATEAVLGDANILILSDREQGPERIAMPALLATAAVHHQLVRQGLRMQTGLVIETGEAREVHHFCALAGYGAEGINPYLAFETLEALRAKKLPDLEPEEVQKNFVKGVGKGILKVMSKMGISTYQSYCGAQIFDAVGLSSEFVDTYFTGTATTIEGIGLKEVAKETVRRHAQAFGDSPLYKGMLDVGGIYQYRIRGEDHAWTPQNIASLQHAVRGKDPKNYEEFAASVNEQSERLLTIRGLMELKKAERPLDISEVEPAAEIVKRFSTGAMSFGSISHEAHSTLAIAMNRIGGRSNTGEGGEEPERFRPLDNGDSMRSRIKQVASGRFGVTTEYLVNSDDIQIKMAQGAKPGEGGQLPGHKVDKRIGKVRHSTPGVGLISPPPHHDIYSIEDLAQLIHDLKNVQPDSRISVKLVSEVGVGTVAAGVSKSKADHLTISGYEGGTGASPLTSLTHAGSPWEIGLAETQQTLLLNDLRSRIAVQVDGGLRTGRDVAIGALLGADEFGFATAPLIAAGCIMMRKCHLNTCPVGVATQDPELRKRFTGTPEHVINYFFFVAEELRQIMAEMGFRTVEEMVGRVDKIDMRRVTRHWKAHGVDLTRILHAVPMQEGQPLHHTETQDHGLAAAMDVELIEACKPAIESGQAVQISREIRNVNRTVGTMLSGRIAEAHGHAGLPQDTIRIDLTGVAGQSFGAWLAHGVTMSLTGDANDYVGKGLSGGRIAVKPPESVGREPTDNIIVGNTVLYGAIAGEAYFAGVAGERFAVRNSGAVAVVEGTGDHALEYMTGGTVCILGKTGRNVAAGMSGGIAYIYDPDGEFTRLVNHAQVDVLDVHPGDGEGAEKSWGKPQQRAVSVDNPGMGDPLYHDAERLKVLIERHHLHTGSARAKALLDDWANELKNFRKVMPRDYARALKTLEDEREDAAMEAAE
ncbi:glutamate synthase large subunit [Qipengyuania sp. 1XM1-15A]|uniref:glutamate synthase large subunit n=1 Tax=Qipengyuania xiamenensis TaxID=2867237 RepID=UPI001C8752F1|nr:glutamate synthase large subunit [Qipengyuania xiamenensis]MBX7532813.1 glutamate synthase large subunit [Qipengyuania xiamenensis]